MRSLFWLFFGLCVDANTINQVKLTESASFPALHLSHSKIKIPDFGVFGNFECNSDGFDSLDAAKSMCKYGTNFVFCDLILETKYGPRTKYFIASTASRTKCSNKSRFKKVAWKGQFLLNQPVGQSGCIGPNDRSYENYSHLKTYETLNLAKIYCQKRFTDCNIIVEVSKEDGLRKMYELGKVDPKGCGTISQTQAEQGIILRLVFKLTH